MNPFFGGLGFGSQSQLVAKFVGIGFRTLEKSSHVCVCIMMLKMTMVEAVAAGSLQGEEQTTCLLRYDGHSPMTIADGPSMDAPHWSPL